MPPAAVVIAPVVTADVPIYLDEIGKTVAKESVTIQPQVSGKLDRRDFADGADVKAGQKLFTIDRASVPGFGGLRRGAARAGGGAAGDRTDQFQSRRESAADPGCVPTGL